MEKLELEERAELEGYLLEWINRLNKNLEIKLFSDKIEAYEEYKYLENIFLNNESYFLNFNYTDTLEKIYEIDKNRILHIHGSADNYSILASVRNFSPLAHFGIPKNLNFDKPVDGLIEKLIKWLEENNIDEEYDTLDVYGFNFNGRDSEYLKAVLFKVPTIKEIKFSVHQAEQIKNKEENNAYLNIRKILNEQPRSISILDFEGNTILS